jgi:hypothetical protein
MKFLKAILVGAAKFAYALFISPIVELKNLATKTVVEKVVCLLNAASRVAIMASWFVGVPSILLALAWVWFWISLAIAVVYIGFLVLSGSAGLALFMALINKAAADHRGEAVEEPVVAAV